MTEKKLKEIAEEAVAAVRAAYPDAEEILPAFSNGDCYLDVKLGPDKWIKIEHQRGED